jgi:hypothetical protein
VSKVKSLVRNFGTSFFSAAKNLRIYIYKLPFKKWKLRLNPFMHPLLQHQIAKILKIRTEKNSKDPAWYRGLTVLFNFAHINVDAMDDPEIEKTYSYKLADKIHWSILTDELL